jgi:hypothetical protein
VVLGAALPHHPESPRISNQVATLEVAKAEFEASWKQWKAWARLKAILGDGQNWNFYD